MGSLIMLRNSYITKEEIGHVRNIDAGDKMCFLAMRTSTLYTSTESSSHVF